MLSNDEKREPLLCMKEVSKNFANTKALDKVSFEIYPGEIHALLGENGAGKSTLIKILCGVYSCSAGSFIYKGENIGQDVQRISLSVVHQDLGLVDEMSVEENIAQIVGYEQRGPFISWKSTNEKVEAVLNEMGCDINPRAEVSSLSAAEKSMVAISRALARETDILILDEPTASLPQKDVDKLFELLKRLKEKGIAIIYVSHRLDEIFEISQKITVLRNGRLVKTAWTYEMTPEQLVYDLIGKEIETVREVAKNTISDEVLLELKNINTSFVGPVDFKLHEGEILALFGLRGAGHHEVGRCIWGIERKNSGSILIRGEEKAIKTPADAIKCHIGFVSSKRKEEGLAETLSVRENLYANLYALNQGKFSFINLKKEQLDCQRVIHKFSVKTSSEEAAIGTLSGGNQQKIMVARWFEAKSEILIFEEPTIGVDIGAKMDIYDSMKLLLEEGKGILLISSDVEEVCNIAHRVILFDRGGILGEVPRDKISRTYLNGLAAGAIAFDS